MTRLLSFFFPESFPPPRVIDNTETAALNTDTNTAEAADIFQYLTKTVISHITLKQL